MTASSTQGCESTPHMTMTTDCTWRQEDRVKWNILHAMWAAEVVTRRNEG